jgi:hypothetical protein
MTLDRSLESAKVVLGNEQPNADRGVGRRHGQNRGGGEGCGYAASFGQRKRVAHIPTAETVAARIGLILDGQGQARPLVVPRMESSSARPQYTRL